MKTQAKKTVVKNAPVVTISSVDVTQGYSDIVDAVVSGLLYGAQAQSAERASACYAMLQSELPNAKELHVALVEAGKVVLPKTVVKSVSALKTLQFLGTVIPSVEAKIICASSKTSRHYDIVAIAEKVINQHGGKYHTCPKTKQRIWDKKPTVIKAGSAEKALNAMAKPSTPRVPLVVTETPKLRLVALFNEIAKLMPLLKANSDTEKLAFSVACEGLSKRVGIFKD